MPETEQPKVTGAPRSAACRVGARGEGRVRRTDDGRNGAPASPRKRPTKMASVISSEIASPGKGSGFTSRTSAPAAVRSISSPMRATWRKWLRSEWKAASTVGELPAR